MISQNFPICLILILPCFLAITTNYTGTLQGSQTFKILTYPVPAGCNIATVQFKVYNAFYSNVIALASFNNDFESFSIKSITSLIIQANPILSQMDVISAIGGYSQVINMYIPTPYPTQIYIALYNFDFPEINTVKYFYLTLSFNLNIVICRLCSYGTNIQKKHIDDLSCQCTTCSLNRVGVSCQYTLNPLSPGINQKIDVFQSKDIYYIVKNTGQPVKLKIKDLKNSGNIDIYVQYQYRWGLLAGKLNNHYVDETSPLIFTFQPQQTTVQIQSLFSYDILLTVKNSGTSLGTVSITYITQSLSSSSSLQLVFAIVFGLVGSAILFLVIFKIVTFCKSRNTLVLHINRNNLTCQQIDKYFPQVKATALLLPQSDLLFSEDSITDLTQSNSSATIYKYQCSICYQNIKADDLIRVTYCRHIFHSKCLSQWFSKSQNCPNCRMSSEYEETKAKRKIFTREQKKKPEKLVRTILGPTFLEQLRTSTLVKKEKEENKKADVFNEKDIQIQGEKKTEKENVNEEDQS